MITAGDFSTFQAGEEARCHSTITFVFFRISRDRD